MIVALAPAGKPVTVNVSPVAVRTGDPDVDEEIVDDHANDVS